MSSMSLLRASCLATCLLAAGASQAGTFEVKLPSYDGNGVIGVSETIGTFNLGLPPGESVIGATISGFFGNTFSSSTAAQEVYADGILVATCIYDAECWNNVDDPLKWSHTFTAAELATGKFADGEVVLTALQTDCCVIRLGETTLSGVTAAAVPEPETYALMLGGLAVVAWAARRRA